MIDNYLMVLIGNYLESYIAILFEKFVHSILFYIDDCSKLF